MDDQVPARTGACTDQCLHGEEASRETLWREHVERLREATPGDARRVGRRGVW